MSNLDNIRLGFVMLGTVVIGTAALAWRSIKNLGAGIAREMTAYAKITAEAAEATAGALWREFSQEYLPVLRTRTGANATLLKALGVFGVTISPTLHNNLVTALVLIGMGITFANVIIGRKNAAGPIITPRDGAYALGPGAAADLARSEPRTFVDPGKAGAAVRGPGGTIRRAKPSTFPV